MSIAYIEVCSVGRRGWAHRLRLSNGVPLPYGAAESHTLQAAIEDAEKVAEDLKELFLPVIFSDDVRAELERTKTAATGGE
jgi:hypothetical protein